MPQQLGKTSLSISQNFLTSQNLVSDLLHKTSITKEDIVYEIGSGLGTITQVLAKNCKKVVAIELDYKLYSEFSKTLKDQPNVEIRKEDFLTTKLPETPYKVFSNIPFNLTASIIKKLIWANNPPVDSYLFVQKEAANKYLGLPYGKGTQMSTLIKPWFELSVIHNFNKFDFKPVPNVDIVLIRIKRLEQPAVSIENKNVYQDFVSYSFNAWKPNVKEALAKIFTDEQFQRLSKNLKFPISVKPSELSFEQWLGLFNYFQTNISGPKKEIVRGSYQKLLKQQAGLSKINRTRLAANWRTTKPVATVLNGLPNS